MTKLSNQNLKSRILSEKSHSALKRANFKLSNKNALSKQDINSTRPHHRKIYVWYNEQDGIITGIQTNGMPADYALGCCLIHELDYAYVGIVYRLGNFGSFMCTKKIRMGADDIVIVLDEVVVKGGIYTTKF